MTYLAHSLPDRPESEWQPINAHLKNVALLTAEFAEDFHASELGYLAGLWHDLGKYSREFQDYLRRASEASAESLPGKVDHSSAGSQYSARTIPFIGYLLSYVIAGHHSGLLDGRAVDACQEKRLEKQLPFWEHGLEEVPQPKTPVLPDFLRLALASKDAFKVAFFTRMLFSCLVDADFLDTERFMNPGQAERRNAFPNLSDLSLKFFQSLDRLESRQVDNPLSTIRHAIRLDCERAAALPPGFFSLTVPTGGGKTLSALAFALRHFRATDHPLQRIVYVAPFTTIIEQNADVFREHLGNAAVLEHHSNLEPEKESRAARLAAENWDAPVIVTTSVQFYDSLFSNKTSRCRKLHRLARSIIILDEAQTLPVEYLHPCLRALSELVANYHSTVVLCTATQPEIKKREDFEIGIEGVREIVTDPEHLYDKLKRVEIIKLARQTDKELSQRILGEDQNLCIVNTTKHARQLFDALGEDKGHFHLSARMCPAHRRLRLRQIRRALENWQICRVVSTQVVEAGVDLDFPVVYRALAGLDSIAQAAGRCNRNGMLPELGKTYVFSTEHPRAESYFADTANCAGQVMELYPDPLDLRANEHYFKLYYWDQKSRWDARHILDNFHLEQNREFPLNFGFATTARDFNLIDDKDQCAVIIPWGRKGRELCERLRSIPEPSREILHQAQRFMVRVRRHTWDRHIGANIRLIYDNLGILESPETHYSKETGLNLKAEGPGGYYA
ncbi:MAG: CRISPR-associated helicase Cas3' [Candidatus Erginobacter occultus]|nr:CRISPR-associated helicase Cas3' [Candidatus Erginobacter occultus]